MTSRKTSQILSAAKTDLLVRALPHNISFFSAEPPFADYELTARLRACTSIKQTRLAGTDSPGKRSRWLPTTGVVEASGVFLHIVPTQGECGILLPPEAKWHWTGCKGFPSGGYRTAGFGLPADWTLGHTVGLCLRYGRLCGEEWRLRAVPACTALHSCAHFGVEHGLEVYVRFDPRVAHYPKRLLDGRLLHLEAEFYQGFVQALDGLSQDKALKCLRAIWRGDVEWRLANGELVTGARERRMKMRVEKVVLPTRCGFPVVDGWCVHPSGLVWRM